MINNRQKRSLIIKAIMLLLAFIVMIFVATLAWYCENLTATAEGVSVSTESGNLFEVAIGFKNTEKNDEYTLSKYGKDINLTSLTTTDGTTGVNVLAKFSPIDITGDGVTFVRPSMKDKNIDIDRTKSTYTDVFPNKEYISFDMYFKSEEKCSVYLDEDSFAKGLIELNDGTLDNQTELTEDNRKADEGNYSKDAIVGAVRVAFVNYGDSILEKDDPEHRESEARVLWLPRPDIHLNSTNTYTGWTLSTGVKPNEILDEYETVSDRLPTRFADTYTHNNYRYDYDDVNGSYVGVDMNYAETITDPTMLPICDITEKIGDYYYGKTQVNIWIEGCDAEARRTMSGGKFKINLDLAGSAIE